MAPQQPEAAGDNKTSRTAKTVPFDQRLDRSKLPRPVADMVDAIMLAVNSGKIDDLRTAIEWNELPPSFSADAFDDPIAYLKAQSQDGGGAEALAILGNLLGVGPARMPLGRDLENNDVYVWPYLAELPLASLTPSQQVDLYRLVPTHVIAEMRQSGRWTWYRVAIGADGTWHAFMRHP